MALIPSDAGVRLRLQSEIATQPVSRLQEIPPDLPDLRTGQIFSALIQESLPENTYRALVAGKSITLSLPESVKSGDTLELVVLDRTPKTIIAQRAEQSALTGAAAGAGEPYKFTTLSKAAQLIGTLLSSEGEAATPAPLNRGQAILAQPPQTGAELAQALGKAVSQSGLFYESHQAQWVAGKLPLAALLEEPQGRYSAPATLVAQAELDRQATQGRGVAETPSRVVDAMSYNNAGIMKSSAGSQEAAGMPQSAQTTLTQTIPNELRPLVHQQLDAVASQRVFWHGEVWPGQTMDWEIEREQTGDREARDGDESEASDRWGTRLRLTTPRLGTVEAALQLDSGSVPGVRGIRISLSTPYGASAADLRAAQPALELALEAAGVPLLGMTVMHESEHGTE